MKRLSLIIAFSLYATTSLAQTATPTAPVMGAGEGTEPIGSFSFDPTESLSLQPITSKPGSAETPAYVRPQDNHLMDSGSIPAANPTLAPIYNQSTSPTEHTNTLR